MKITILNSNLDVSIHGVPSMETFTLTAKQLARWNQLDPKFDGVSFNEAWNAEQGLPCPSARRWLRSLRSSLYGICPQPLTMSDVKRSLES